VLITRLSVRENLHLFGDVRGIEPEVLEHEIEELCSALQLTEMLDNYAGDLSGGQKRKLCVAIALLGHPPMIIMDEPTAGVDVQARQLIWKIVAGLENTTSLITTHALEEAETVSSRLFIICDHQIRFTGTATELRNQYKCGYLLRVERDDGTVGGVLELAQRFVTDSYLCEDRTDTIAMLVDEHIPDFLEELATRQTELGVRSYSFAVEQLEDLMLRMIA
jgi:ABC-type multidrug transport system ATPase subunit